MQNKKRRMMILTEGQLGVFSSKTATCLVRYCPDEVACILDSRAAKSGKPLEEFLGVGAGIPIVSSVKEGLAHKPTQLTIGIAPVGGKLPAAWRKIVLDSIRAGLDVVSGLHHILGDDKEFAAAAKRKRVRIHDVRVPPANLDVAHDRLRALRQRRIALVGSDCSVGKMLTAVELSNALRKRGWNSDWIATGQTGIMIHGDGIAVDHVLSDYVNGAAEQLCYERRNKEIVVVEGQGSAYHPAYSGVTVGLLHGSMPHAMVFVHQPSRKTIGHYEQFPLPPITQAIALCEALTAPIYPAKVAAIALNTVDLDDAGAEKVVCEIEMETGLPACDPIRHGAEKLAVAVENAVGKIHR
ncbi:MAG TPA: DUF1611 domain-containing protein [Planctomycetota bacterium]|nr:DUF1611 domain-containing protein [Planctomycetota bacterium]